jgi:hypothetical protein
MVNSELELNVNMLMTKRRGVIQKRAMDGELKVWTYDAVEIAWVKVWTYDAVEIAWVNENIGLNEFYRVLKKRETYGLDVGSML